MSITFNGVSLSVGAPFNADKSVGSVGGRGCHVVSGGGLGISLDPFWFEIPCDCPPQQGDTIVVESTTILFIDITEITWSLCGGQCTGSSSDVGISLGLDIKKLKWVVD
ncbi:MAG TPA: hypothetical protein VF092_27855 [Longimicrobium sp.]